MARPYKIWYKREPTFQSDPNLTVANLEETHVEVAEVLAWGPDDAYYLMQGEVWSPDGEARDLLTSLGVTHTSLSIGDVIYNAGEDEWLELANDDGWRKLPGIPPKLAVMPEC